MNRTISLSFLPLVLVCSFVFVQQARGQEIAPIAKLAQEYLMRMNAQEGRYATPENVVNPEQFQMAALIESIETVNKTVEEVRAEKARVISEVQESVKQDIDTSIVTIRKTTETPAYELQRAIDAERTSLFENVTRTVDEIQPGSPERISQLQIEVAQSLDRIKASLEQQAGIPADFQKSQRDVRSILMRFEQVLAQKRQVIDSRSGELIFQDGDEDGLSDYDELYIYKTDPASARTKGENRTDGEKVRDGINPLSDTEEKMAYQDPREDKEAFVSSTYKVNKIQLLKQDDGDQDLMFEGVALPNSYVTLFIYSTPIMVTVRTDTNGTWTYEMEQELENGEHQMYVATVDNSGKLLARSNPILFTKSAEAATIGIAGSLEQSVGAQTFLKDNFILITLAVLIAVVVLTMMFVGNRRDLKAVVADLHNEVNQK